MVSTSVKYMQFIVVFIRLINSESWWYLFSPLHATFPVILPSSQCLSFLLLRPSTQPEVIIIHMGYYIVNKLFLPKVNQVLSDCGSARSWWTEVDLSRKAGRAHDSSSSENPALVVTHGNQHVNTHNFAARLKCSGLSPLLTRVGQWGLAVLWYILCISQNDRGRLRGGGFLVKESFLSL